MHKKAIEVMLELDYTETEISYMNWNQIIRILNESDFNYCDDCGNWLHKDQFADGLSIYDDETSICDDCK